MNIQEVSLYHQAGEHHVPFECWVLFIIYLSTNHTITIESIHRRDAAHLSRMDALEFNDDNNDEGDHVARSLEFEIDDTDF